MYSFLRHQIVLIWTKISIYYTVFYNHCKASKNPYKYEWNIFYLTLFRFSITILQTHFYLVVSVVTPVINHSPRILNINYVNYSSFLKLNNFSNYQFSQKSSFIKRHFFCERDCKVSLRGVMTSCTQSSYAWGDEV